MPSNRLSSSISDWVNSPSPDHYDVSTFISLQGMVDGQQSTEYRVVPDVQESPASHQLGNRRCTGVPLDGSRNVSVGVGFAVKQPTQKSSDQRKIGEVGTPDPRVRRTIEIERQRLAALAEDPVDLVDGDRQIRPV